MGFHDQLLTNSTVAQNGCYFISENGMTWQAVTISGAASQTTNTIIPCDNNWRVFEINVDQFANKVDFKINNIVVATHTTGIPKTSGAQTCIGYRTFRLTNDPYNVELRLDWQSLIIKRQVNLWL